MKAPFILLIAILAVIPPVFAQSWLSEKTFTDPITYILISAAILALASVISLQGGSGLAHRHKKLIFLIITVPVVLSTMFLGAHTIYKNITSVTGGPIHWHADYQIWVCDSRADLIDPKFPSNKIGTPLFHEHNDDRVHVEGTVSDFKDVNLAKYFEVIGGKLTDSEIVYPAIDGVISYRNGENCPGQGPGSLKVYVNGNLMEEHSEYVLDDVTIIPTCKENNGVRTCRGDCIIIVFDETQDQKTDRICESLIAKGVSYANYEVNS